MEIPYTIEEVGAMLSIRIIIKNGVLDLLKQRMNTIHIFAKWWYCNLKRIHRWEFCGFLTPSINRGFNLPIMECKYCECCIVVFGHGYNHFYSSINDLNRVYNPMYYSIHGSTPK